MFGFGICAAVLQHPTLGQRCSDDASATKTLYSAYSRGLQTSTGSYSIALPLLAPEHLALSDFLARVASSTTSFGLLES